MRTRVAALVASMVVALAACGAPKEIVSGSDSTTTTARATNSGTGAELVLRIDSTGGFVAPRAHFDNVPAVSLYDDGTIITTGPTTAEYPGRAIPNIIKGTLSNTDTRDLVTGARDAGVVDPAPDLGQPAVADAPDTRFMVRSNDKTVTVSVNALDMSRGPGLTTAQAAARAKLTAFRDRALRSAARSTDRYTPTSLAVLIEEYPAGETTDVVPGDADWPGEDLATRSATPRLGGRCITVAGPEFVKVWPAAQSARSNTRWHSGSKTFQLTLRPELPDEHICQT